MLVMTSPERDGRSRCLATSRHGTSRPIRQPARSRRSAATAKIQQPRCAICGGEAGTMGETMLSWRQAIVPRPASNGVIAMALKYWYDARSCGFSRRMSDALRRRVRLADVGDVLSGDVNVFTAALEAQSRPDAGEATSPALRYAACEALDHFGFDAAIDREG